MEDTVALKLSSFKNPSPDCNSESKRMLRPAAQGFHFVVGVTTLQNCAGATAGLLVREPGLLADYTHTSALEPVGGDQAILMT